MELAAELGRAQPGRLIMAAISAVFTIGYVANLLGEDENWLYDLSINMFPEDGCLWVHGVGEDGVLYRLRFLGHRIEPYAAMAVV